MRIYKYIYHKFRDIITAAGRLEELLIKVS